MPRSTRGLSYSESVAALAVLAHRERYGLRLDYRARILRMRARRIVAATERVADLANLILGETD